MPDTIKPTGLTISAIPKDVLVAKLLSRVDWRVERRAAIAAELAQLDKIQALDVALSAKIAIVEVKP